MKKILNIIVIIIFTSACGFKVIKQPEIRNFYIAEIKVEGDKRINYIIKRNLLNSLKDKSKKPLKLILETKKIKDIKERNIKKEITKYQITINVIVKYEGENTKNIGQIEISKIGEFNVNKQHSQTINNEKQSIEILTNSLQKEIILQLSVKLNDI